MAGEKALTKSELAAAAGCHKSLLSQGRYKSMPSFYRVEDFLAWRAATAKRVRKKSKPVEVVEGSRVLVGAPPLELPPDWESYQITPEEFEEVALARAVRVANLAHALVEAAIKSGNLEAGFGSVRTWAEVQRQTLEVKKRWLEVQKADGALIDLDSVLSIAGRILQSLRAGVLALGQKAAATANPGDPARAAAAIDAAVDSILGEIESAAGRLLEEVSGK